MYTAGRKQVERETQQMHTAGGRNAQNEEGAAQGKYQKSSTKINNIRIIK